MSSASLISPGLLKPKCRPVLIGMATVVVAQFAGLNFPNHGNTFNTSLFVKSCTGYRDVPVINNSKSSVERRPW